MNYKGIRNMGIKEITDIISTTGFPIAVTIYLLHERNNTMTKFTQALTELTQSVNILVEYVKGKNAD